MDTTHNINSPVNMMNENPKMYLGREEMRDLSYSTLDLDMVLEVLESDLADLSLPPNDTPAEEEFGPQQPETECYMPPGAVLLCLQQPVLPAPEFHAAQTSFPLGPPYYAPDEERFGPQQPQTECYMNLGAYPFSLQQPVMPALAPPMYEPPTVLQQNYMYCQGDFNHSQLNNVTVMTLPQSLGMNLAPFGFMSGNFVYGVPAYAGSLDTFDVPKVKASSPQKRKFNRKPDDESKPYVKKPPNAFMIFRMEQRPTVVAELQNPECAAVNRIIGQRWQSLPKEEQAKYYKHADTERQLHSQRFPEWSAIDNYGIKKKRIRRKVPAITEDSSV